MNIEIEFKVKERVWDIITKSEVSIISVVFIDGRCPYTKIERESFLFYYVKGKLVNGTRFPGELNKIERSKI